MIVFFRIPTVNSVEWSPVKPEADDIDYLQIGGPNAISMKMVERLAPNDFWQSLPIKEGESAFMGSSSKVIQGGCLILMAVINYFL